MSVAQIFAEDGEEGFRDVEAAVLNEVASYGRVVVSTGGGVVSRPQNWGHLRNGIVIYLEAPVECVACACACGGATSDVCAPAACSQLAGGARCG